MCGIAGVFDPRSETSPGHLSSIASRTADRLRHRGPDGDGVWVDASEGIALGHRRLSIIDLTEAGQQPMASASGRYVVTYNGEIYNYRQLTKELASGGVRFRGTSDTEVLVAAIDAWGLDLALQRLDGMFAFGLWDRERKSLTLVRDRFGEKPLYWGWSEGRLLFASELRALAAVCPGLDIDRRAIAELVARKAIPAPLSVFEQIRKLRPAHRMTVSAGRDARIESYWSAEEAARTALDSPLDIPAQEAAEELRSRMRDTVGSRMVADVPVGAFLSGGVDSAGVVAFMLEAATGPVRTFTVGLDDPRYDESALAAQLAAHLGTAHDELRVTPADAMAVVPELSEIYDEPFADSSQVPTLLVSQHASRSVKVALSGDGGDEIFGGYNRHVQAARIVRLRRLLPAGVRVRLGDALMSLDPVAADSWHSRIEPAIPRNLRFRLPGDKLHKLGRALRATTPGACYRSLLTDADPAQLMSACPPEAVSDDRVLVEDLPFSQAMMLADVFGYLPDDILVKLDRAAMSCSLETRAPYLSHELFEWSWRLPHELKVRGGLGKRVLRDAVRRQLGGFDLAATKSGFGTPIGEWLRGDLRDWASDVLSPDQLRTSGLFEQERVGRLLGEHLRGERDNTHVLWSLLMASAWLQGNRSRVSTPSRA